MEEAKNEEPMKSKYPDGYEDKYYGTVQSNYNPIVGEINNVDAILPPPPQKVEVIKPAQKSE